ncbi:MAG TPA: TonB-dependent receptor [Phycisphaerales bacterium]|nr:TonB-dependent receptor [Phycisphaerales bacterium]
MTKSLWWWLTASGAIFGVSVTSKGESDGGGDGFAAYQVSVRTAPLIVKQVCWSIIAAPQDAGSIRGTVTDADFDVPLSNAQITIAETNQTAQTTEDGHYVISGVASGTYTLVFVKDGFVRQVKSGVVVTGGQLTDVDVAMPGEFTDLEEFVVEDLQLGGGTEAQLLQTRFQSPAIQDNISAEFMSRAGASDAAAALKLVSGATVEGGKYAVIRGLPDRYVNSQINGIRLPTADENKRAVQLDQFPSPAIESIQVSKTFTPDQQGDASGGAVNVVLKGIPSQTILQFKSEVSYNSQATGRRDFLTYDGGGLNYWGKDNGSRDPQLDRLGQNWLGAAGASDGRAPTDYKWSGSAGGKYEFENGIKVGGFGSLFYKRDSEFYDNGIDDSYWQVTPGVGLVPRTIQGTPDQGDFKTQLFDVTQASQSVQWGGLATFGVESKNHSINLTYLYTRIAEDTVTVAEDTRGKAYFFPGYDPNDSHAFGNSVGNLNAAPYLRTETLEYTERTTSTLQLKGKHKFDFGEFGIDDVLKFKPPELDWAVANSEATQDQPDKRQFGALWKAPSYSPGFPPFIPPSTSPPTWLPFKPASNFLLGNYQRIFKNIDEESNQYAVNLNLPFKQWTDSDGYFKFGVFHDHVKRTFNQDTFSNFNDNTASYSAPFDNPWSEVFPTEDHPIVDGPPFVDVDYDGDQKISASYAMADVPLTSWFNVIGGARWESTRIGIVNFAEENATWFPPGALAGVALNPGDADVDFKQNDLLPSIGLVFKPLKPVTLRASYSETVARQTFKELTPILQQEYLGGDIFIGNPDLQMSALKNYDLRLDYTPYDGGLLSASYFHKDITGPIEYVQRVAGGFVFTTPVNYPKGKLDGIELEIRQSLGQFWDGFKGLSVGANATFIDSQVTLPEDEEAMFEAPNIAAPMPTRDMTNAPDHLYNFYLTYDLESTGTQFSIFYTVRGDTLVAGAGESLGNFVPNVYETEYGTLNFTVSQKLFKFLTLQFQAKNLTNPAIETVYRSKFIGDDVVKTSYTKGIDYSIGLSAEFTF